jgi:cell division protein FtsW (lipid II flippase)
MNLHYDVSIIKVLILLFILKMGSEDNNINIMLKNNKLVKHITLIITISVLLSLLYKDLSLTQLIFYSMIIYVLYLLSIKIDKKYVLIFCGLLSIIYFNDYENNKKINITKKDKILTSNDKYNIISNINKENKNILIVFIVFTLGLSLLYDDKQYEQHGNNYSLFKFLEI